MKRPEPIELENNLGPDAVTGEINRVPWMAYDVDEMDLYIAEKDAEIAELKKKLMPCLNGDCILTCEVVEKYGKENAELKQKLEDAKASHYAEMVDAGMENCRLKEAQRWRKCSEEMPEDGAEVLASDGDGIWLCYKTTMCDGSPWFQPDGQPHIEGVTHWMPLPSAPREEK